MRLTRSFTFSEEGLKIEIWSQEDLIKVIELEDPRYSKPVFSWDAKNDRLYLVTKENKIVVLTFYSDKIDAQEINNQPNLEVKLIHKIDNHGYLILDNPVTMISFLVVTDDSFNQYINGYINTSAIYRLSDRGMKCDKTILEGDKQVYDPDYYPDMIYKKYRIQHDSAYSCRTIIVRDELTNENDRRLRFDNIYFYFKENDDTLYTCATETEGDQLILRQHKFNKRGEKNILNTKVVTNVKIPNSDQLVIVNEKFKMAHYTSSGKMVAHCDSYHYEEKSLGIISSFTKWRQLSFLVKENKIARDVLEEILSYLTGLPQDKNKLIANLISSDTFFPNRGDLVRFFYSLYY